MDYFTDNVIFTRRSIRKFEDKPVEAEKIGRIIKAGMQAPSARNLQPWEFLVITDKKKLEAVSKMSTYAALAAKAPCVIIVLGNVKENTEQRMKWIQQDLSACTENILLQIAAEHLGGVWLGFYPDEERYKAVSEYFNLPDYIIPFSVIAFGYSEDKNYYLDRFNINKVHYNSFSSDVNGQEQ